MNKFTPAFLLIEPAPVLRQSLQNWLAADFPSCNIHEAENLSAALELPAEENLRVILLDLDILSEADWINIRRLAERYPKSDIIGMGLDDTSAHRQRAEDSGVTAFVSKSQLQGELASVLQANTEKLNSGKSHPRILTHKENSQ